MNSLDDRLTFLLPRPVWVNDLDVTYCNSCNNAFGPLKRRHHCRNCGNIFCQECSSRKVPLPQLGYGTKPVRVCNGCFDVCYLVTYSIDEDHGISTQIHGVRGLLELTEKDQEKDLHNMVAYGGVDALIWLCRSSRSARLHHLTTTILALLAEKESIRPVIITKWALPPLLILIRHYISTDSPANSIHSGETEETETRQSIILEIIINCTHILYQLSRAGILSQKEVIQEGVFDILLTLASFDVEKDNEPQMKERISIIQNLAAKAISTISSLVAFQGSIIELIQGTSSVSTLLRSNNDEVRKYMAKTIAYLSLRNDKYKPNLLGGEGSRALISILAVLPQKEDMEDRLKDLSYYLSQDIKDIKSVERASDKSLNSAAVSHACCALANFATNNESQINLMSQPHLLKYICNVPLIFPTHTEIHRHVARCLANLSLYEENLKSMLINKNDTRDGVKDCYNVLPTLLIMGKTSTLDVSRHIVRAIDNLSSNVPESKNEEWKKLFGEAYVYMCQIVKGDEGNEKDVDTMKRAKSIIARREKLLGIEQKVEDMTLKEDKAQESSSTEESANHLIVENKPIQDDADMKQDDTDMKQGDTTISSTEDDEEVVQNNNASKKKKKSRKNKK